MTGHAPTNAGRHRSTAREPRRSGGRPGRSAAQRQPRLRADDRRRPGDRPGHDGRRDARARRAPVLPRDDEGIRLLRVPVRAGRGPRRRPRPPPQPAHLRSARRTQRPPQARRTRRRGGTARPPRRCSPTGAASRGRSRRRRGPQPLPGHLRRLRPGPGPSPRSGPRRPPQWRTRSAPRRARAARARRGRPLLRRWVALPGPARPRGTSTRARPRGAAARERAAPGKRTARCAAPEAG